MTVGIHGYDCQVGPFSGIGSGVDQEWILGNSRIDKHHQDTNLTLY